MKRYFVLLIVLILCPFIALYAQDVITVAGTGTGGYMGDNVSAISAELNSPDAVKFDHSGNMYIADEYNHVIRKVSTSGTITTIAGIGGVSGHTGDNGPASSAELNRPVDLTIDMEGNLFVSEYGNEDIRKINNIGIITTIAGNGASGYNGDSIMATSAQLYGPIGLIFDNSGNLYFSDNGNRRVRKINMATGIIYTIAGTGTAGYTGDNGPAIAAEMRLPGYITFSPSGELYIPDYNNYVIRKIDSAGVITTIAGTGTSGYTGDGGPATAATFTSAFAIIFDPSGNMFISDRVLGVIRKIDATTGIITTIAGIGVAGYAGDGGPATAAQFNTDVNCSAIDDAGNLYVADPINNRIRVIVYHPLGVNNMVNAQNITIYPNPASGKVTIASPGLSQGEEIKSVEIINLIGQQFYKQSYNNVNNAEIDVSSFANGVYFVKVNGIYLGRFVKE